MDTVQPPISRPGTLIFEYAVSVNNRDEIVGFFDECLKPMFTLSAGSQVPSDPNQSSPLSVRVGRAPVNS